MRFLPLAFALALVACGGSADTNDNGGGDSGAPIDSNVSDTTIGDSSSSDTSKSDSSSSDTTSGDTSTSDTTSDDSSAIDTGIPDVSSDTPTSPCPPTIPPSAYPCSPVGLECTYGDDPRPGCRTDALCAKGKWLITSPGPSCTSSAPPCPSPVPDGTACDARGEVCADGDKECACGCELACTTPRWTCVTRDPGCPADPPELGSLCTAPSSSVCDYGNCMGGLAEQCTGGIWVRAKTLCPG